MDVLPLLAVAAKPHIRFTGGNHTRIGAESQVRPGIKCVRGAALAEAGRAAEWLGFIVQGRGGWRIVTDAAPADFDPNDYEGNNGPLG